MSKNSKYIKVAEKYTSAILPILNAEREEERHSQEIIDSLLDKIYDTGKLLLGFSLPALITVYTLKSNDLQQGQFLLLTLGLAVFGVILMAVVFYLKYKVLGPYRKASVSRLKVLTSYTNLQTALINSGMKSKSKP